MFLVPTGSDGKKKNYDMDQCQQPLPSYLTPQMNILSPRTCGEAGNFKDLEMTLLSTHLGFFHRPSCWSKDMDGGGRRECKPSKRTRHLSGGDWELEGGPGLVSRVYTKEQAHMTLGWIVAGKPGALYMDTLDKSREVSISSVRPLAGGICNFS